MREEEYGGGFSIKEWKKMLPFVRPYYKSLVIIFALMVLVAAIDISFPLFLSYAVDSFVAPRSLQGLPLYSVLYLVLVVVQGCGATLMGRRAMGIEMNLGKDLKRATFLHLQKLGLSYFNQNAVGWILARVMSDTNHICLVVAWSLTDLFWSSFYILGVFGVMLALNWRLALLVITVVPVAALITGLFQGKFLAAHRAMRAANSKITGAYNEGITGAKTSKTLVIEQRNVDDFVGLTREMYRASQRSARLNAVFIPIIIFFSSLALSFVLARGGGMVLGGGLELGTLSAFVVYALSLLEPVQQIARVLADFIATQANIERVTNLLAQPLGIEDKPEVLEKYGDSFNPKPENWEPIVGEIEFDHVWFKYPDGDEWVLEDFCLKIPAGTNVALVGETGAGKSTLVNLACRFYVKYSRNAKNED